MPRKTNFPQTLNNFRKKISEFLSRETVVDRDLQLGDELGSAIKGMIAAKLRNRAMEKESIRNLTSYLPASVMKEKDYNKVYNKAEDLIKDKKFKQAKIHIDRQLKIMANDGNVYAQQRLNEGGAKFGQINK